MIGFKVLKYKVLAVFTAVLFIFSFKTVFAATVSSLDLDETGSISLTLADSEGNTVSGGEITLYQVATLYLDNGDMTYEYTDDFSGCEIALDITDTSIAEVLSQYVTEKDVIGDTMSVGSEGTVLFDNLGLGLYLIVQTTASDSYETISPFIVTVPLDNDGEWAYEVEASPKTGTVTKIETNEDPDSEVEPKDPEEEENTHTDDPDGTLPQTGQLNWPIPVLAICGLILFMAGWLLRNSDSKKEIT